MAGDTNITVVGNLTADPELRFTTSGQKVASLTVASTPRSFDRATNQWKDGEPLYLRGSVWGEMAQNVADSLAKGNRVIVQGRLVQRSYQANDGTNRTSYELQIDEIAPSLRYAAAKLERRTASSNSASNAAPANANTSAANAKETQSETKANDAFPADDVNGDPWETGQADLADDQANSDVPF